jgi:hypothetical protein
MSIKWGNSDLEEMMNRAIQLERREERGLSCDVTEVTLMEDDGELEEILQGLKGAQGTYSNLKLFLIRT